MGLVWERKLTGRPGQAHVFGPDGWTLCRLSERTADWGPAGTATKCATCRRRVDPDNAPKAPKWRRM